MERKSNGRKPAKMAADQPTHPNAAKTAAEKRCFVTNRRCLRCDGQHRSRWPGICKKCKRHVDFKAPSEDDYTI